MALEWGFYIYYFGHKLKNQLQERTQNTTNPSEPAQPERKSRNNAGIYILQMSTNQITTGTPQYVSPITFATP
jgi:hypothetical protein